VARRKPARQPAKAPPPPVGEYRHRETRKNNPPAGLAAQGRVRETPRLQFAYNPHLPPTLRFDPSGALHIHERVATQAILRVAARQDVQRDLFADPQLPYREAVQFSRHDVDWANQMILGDSLQVMASLARRESLAAKVQMIYMDSPYGIRFASNLITTLKPEKLDQLSHHRTGVFRWPR
jgi:adenine-specific DNA-methyltransferase